MPFRAEVMEGRRGYASSQRLHYAQPTPRDCFGMGFQMCTHRSAEGTDYNEAGGSSRAALVASGLVLMFSIVHADTTSTSIAVGARVNSIATYRTLSEQTQLQITQVDIARGFVELPRATQIEVRSNSRMGYVLNVRPMSALFTRVEVLGFGSDIALDADGGSVVQRWKDPGAATVTVGYRFYLSAATAPGTYPWPLHLTVEPL